MAGGRQRNARAHRWAATPLGPITHWPQSLKSAVDLMLGAGFPTLLLWGSDLLQLYNDAYWQFSRCRKMPLGTSFRTTWPEQWSLAKLVSDQVWRGETVMLEEQYSDARLRGGRPSWIASSATPVRDEAGDVAAVWITTIDSSSCSAPSSRRMPRSMKGRG